MNSCVICGAPCRNKVCKREDCRTENEHAVTREYHIRNKERESKWRKENADRIRAINRKYRRKYRAQHLEEVRAYDREYAKRRREELPREPEFKPPKPTVWWKEGYDK